MLALLNTLRYSETRSVTDIWPSIKHPKEEQTESNIRSQ